MASRRPHKKSRLGCRTCKQRRVKCDERGPPCGPCRMKGIECEYSKVQAPIPRSPAPKDHQVMGPASANIVPASLDTASDWNPSRRKLELELLQHWTSTTYKSYCGTIEEEYHNWQITVPKLALRYDCLLHGLFAMVALEIGAFSEDGGSEEYIYHALHYQNLASSELREELSTTDLVTVSQEKHQALWALSSILMVLSLALPPFAAQNGERYNMLEHITTFHELSKGFVILVHSKIKSLKDDPLLCNYKQWDELETLPIGPDTQKALERLKALNEETYGASRTDHHTSELEAMNYHAACRKALFFLEECFAKCSTSETRAYGLGWLLLSGDDFLKVLKNKEPVALVILMHWAALLEQQSYGVWYVQRVGKALVEDLSDDVSLVKNEKLGDALNWAREQVGLQPKS